LPQALHEASNHPILETKTLAAVDLRFREVDALQLMVPKLREVRFCYGADRAKQSIVGFELEIWWFWALGIGNWVLAPRKCEDREEPKSYDSRTTAYWFGVFRKRADTRLTDERSQDLQEKQKIQSSLSNDALSLFECMWL
jgi:hypothetical protein